MKSKKGLIILSTVVVVCAVGFIVSPLVNWSTDSEATSGNIGKSSRFSRKTATENISNMEELLQNDEAFKDGVVASYVVMQTRAIQFGTLVDMSKEVAGDIPAFAEILKDMNEARVMVTNVNASLVAAGDDLNAALGGEGRPDLAQNTINAALAYSTLQKQNKLADRFIETTDKYLATADGDDRLKFVRDQWLEYQQVSAALDGDEKKTEALAKKGILLSGEKCLAAMDSFDLSHQISVLTNSALSKSLDVSSNLVNALPAGVVNNVFETLQHASETTLQSMEINEHGLQSQETYDVFFNVAKEGLHLSQDVMNAAPTGAELSSHDQTQLNSWDQTRLGHEIGGLLSAISEEQLARSSQDLTISTLAFGNTDLVIKAYGENIMNNIANTMNMSQNNLGFCGKIGDAISSLSLGNVNFVQLGVQANVN